MLLFEHPLSSHAQKVKIALDGLAKSNIRFTWPLQATCGRFSAPALPGSASPAR